MVVVVSCPNEVEYSYIHCKYLKTESWKKPVWTYERYSKRLGKFFGIRGIVDIFVILKGLSYNVSYLPNYNMHSDF
jgi:hypothetical protein